MKARRRILMLGMILYLVSFFMPAVLVNVYGGKLLAGGECAYFALFSPIRELNDVAHHRVPQPPPLSGEILLLISGLINPVFLISVVALLLNPTSKLSTILRIVLLGMFAAPWYFFRHPGSDLYPRVGYFVWMAAMLLVMVADNLGNWVMSRSRQEVPA
jgi:hypothetical protein